MKGLVMKTAAALALAMFCLIIGPLALYGEDIVTEPILTFSGHNGGVHSAAFSPDGTNVLTGSYDNSAMLWDAATGAHIRTFSGHTGYVWSVAFSPDSAKVLTGATAGAALPDNTARLWDVGTGSCIRTFSGHTSHVMSAVFSPDGTMVLTGSDDRTARLWDALTGAHIRTFTGHTTSVNSVAFSPDGTMVLTGSSDRTAQLWDATTGAHTRTFIGHLGGILSVAFSPDGKKVLTGAGWGECTARLWDVATGALIRGFVGHTDNIHSVAFSPDGTTVLAGSNDNTARLWDAATGTVIRTFMDTDDVHSASFSPDGTKVLTGSSDSTARLWDAGPGLLVRSSPIAGVSIAGDAPGLTDFGRVYYQRGQSVMLTAPAVALDFGVVRYDFVRWEIDGQQKPAGQLSVQFTVDHSMTALAVYEIRKHTIAVRSEPVSGITISGDAAGVTDFSATADDQQAIILSAPLTAAIGGHEYNFVRWSLDGVQKPEGAAALHVTMDADHTAVATYFRTCGLAVTSSPFSGAPIVGDVPGTTNYSAAFHAPRTITLTAQAGLFVDFRGYVFIRWLIDGQPQPLRQGTIDLTIETDTAAQAVYGLYGDANDDCCVNVLDLIFVRNRLGKDPASGDNWKADINQDGSINVLDLIRTRNVIGAQCGD